MKRPFRAAPERQRGFLHGNRSSGGAGGAKRSHMPRRGCHRRWLGVDRHELSFRPNKSVEQINRSLGSARDDKRTPGMTGIQVVKGKILIFMTILLIINSSNWRYVILPDSMTSPISWGRSPREKAFRREKTGKGRRVLQAATTHNALKVLKIPRILLFPTQRQHLPTFHQLKHNLLVKKWQLLFQKSQTWSYLSWTRTLLLSS